MNTTTQFGLKLSKTTQVTFTHLDFLLDLPDFVELFEDKVIKKKVVEEKKEEVTTVSILDDDKRITQLNLAVKKLTSMMNLSYEDLRQMIVSMDDSELGYDAFLNLGGLAPTKEEITKINNFKGDVETLDLPSRWIYEMKDVPIFEQRIKTFNFSKEFQVDFDSKIDFTQPKKTESK